MIWHVIGERHRARLRHLRLHARTRWGLMFRGWRASRFSYSKHLTRGGVLYNALMRLTRRTRSSWRHCG